MSVVRLRTLRAGDAEAVERLLAARDRHDLGAPVLTLPAARERWRAAGFNAEADAVVADAGDSIVGYGLMLPAAALAVVDPAAEGRGVGAALLAWAEGQARQRRHDCHRQRVAQSNTRATALLSGAGYEKARSAWQMAIALASVPAPLAPPAGITIKALGPEADAQALHLADNRAFADNADFMPEGFESFRDDHLSAPDLDLEASAVAWRGGEIAGYAICRRPAPASGYVDLLAVLPAERRRGLGAALLTRALAAFARAGCREAYLEVVSDNVKGLALYERTGMAQRYLTDVWIKPLSG